MRSAVGLSARRVGQTTLPAEVVHELSQLTQPLEIEEVRRSVGGTRCHRVRGVVGRAERHGGMATIGQADDDVRTLTVADTDDRQLLPAEGVMGMRDGYAS